jgi:hypothetical protein
MPCYYGACARLNRLSLRGILLQGMEFCCLQHRQENKFLPVEIVNERTSMRKGQMEHADAQV